MKKGILGGAALTLALVVVSYLPPGSNYSVKNAYANTEDENAGRLLASNCFTCHGTNGYENGGFDNIAGESVENTIEKMENFASEDEGIMSVHARGYTDEQIRLLAIWLSKQ